MVLGIVIIEDDHINLLISSPGAFIWEYQHKKDFKRQLDAMNTDDSFGAIFTEICRSVEIKGRP